MKKSEIISVINEEIDTVLIPESADQSHRLEEASAKDKFNAPPMNKWWTGDKDALMSAIYHAQRQLPPTNKTDYEKNWKSIVNQLQKKYPAPTAIFKKKLNEADITIGGKEYNLKKSGSKITLTNKKLSADKFIFGNTKEFKAWADDQVEPIGGTQSSNFGINEANLKKGDLVGVDDEIGVVNKVKGRVAYIKLPSSPGSFHPIEALRAKYKGKFKGKDLYIAEGKLTDGTITENYLNEAEYITDKFKKGDKIKTNVGTWIITQTNYKPGKKFTSPFVFKGPSMKKLPVNLPSTNSKAVGYKVKDDGKYPITGFLYQHKDITILATVGVDEAVNEAKVSYNFSEEELKRVLQVLGRNASTEVKIIKAFETALGRKLTRDELFEVVKEDKLNESMIGIQTKANFKPLKLKGALERAGMKGFMLDRLSVTLSALKLDKKYYKEAMKIIDDLGLKVMMAKEGVNEAMDMNDPILVAIRARKTMLAKEKSAPKVKKLSTKQYYKLMDKEIDLLQDRKKAVKDYEELDSEMNQEAGQKGDSWSDADANRYGGKLNDLQSRIESIAKQLLSVKKQIMNYRVN